MQRQSREARKPRQRRWGWALLGAAVLAFCGAPAALAGSATLRWTHPDATSVDGFRVHQSVAGGGFDLGVDVAKPSLDAGGVYTATVSVPDGVAVALRMSAYNSASGLSSEFSANENQTHFLGAPGRPMVVLP